MDYIPTKGGVLMPASGLALGGRYTGQIIRAGEVIDEFECQNLCVDEGLNSLLNIQFNGATQLVNWYMGLFEGNYTPVAGLTAATVAANATETTAYNETTRRQFVPVASTAKSIANSVTAGTFTFNAGKTIYGAFMISDSTKGGTAGVLFSAAKFATAKVVASADQLLLTYTLNASSV
jgi:hypothetical protein